jgi:hypothetical protein
MGGEWFYTEYSGGRGVSSLGGTGNGQAEPLPPEEERNRILDLFRN